jgi:23S rRNA (uracil1939-C5)-methyltransferase
MLPPIHGPTWGYRDRARLSVRHVAKKGTVLVGFHERSSRYVADMSTCPVLPAKVSGMLPALRALIGAMQARDRLPQIEFAAGEEVTALVLRHLEPLSPADLNLLAAFGAEHGVQWWLQAGGPETARLLEAGGAELAYRLSEFDLTMPFKPTEFTQVNRHVNAVLVQRAVTLLAPAAGDRIIDWFCGLGNFSLPLARRAREVLGIEGSAALVQRAGQNAHRNGLADRARFAARNLFELKPADLQGFGAAERWLVDPPREGAFALFKALVDALVGALPGGSAAVPAWTPPVRIVYVSCNPATLARDAGLLVHQAGYRCTHAGVVNMFPHTAHTESIAVFDRDAPE